MNMSAHTISPETSDQSCAEKFNRQRAKDQAAVTLQKVIPKYLTFADAARLTGTDISNIKRAHSAQSLLNARAFVDIIKDGFKLKSTHLVSSVIDNNADLDKYLKKQLGEEYTNPFFEDKNDTYILLNALNTITAQRVYALLETQKIIKVSSLKDIFGNQEAMKVIEDFTAHELIIHHEKLGIIELPRIIDSHNIIYNKQQMILISESLEAKSINSQKSQYEWHSTLATKDQEDRLYSAILAFRQNIGEIISEIKQTDSSQRTELVSYSVAYTTPLSMNDSQKGLNS